MVMITGDKKYDKFELKDLWKITNQGLDIYTHYLGKIQHGAMKRPWGKDKHPSWSVWKSTSGLWKWKDQATEEMGDGVDMVMRMYNLSLPEAVHKILGDMRLIGVPVDAERVNEERTKEDVYQETIHITAKIMKFTPRHHKFWNAVGVTEDYCKKFNCFAVKELAINRRKVNLGVYERVFVYLADDINKVKIYFPDREGGGRFRNNAPNSYIWGLSKLQSCERVVVHKSMKDLITFSQLYPHNVATQNESVHVFKPEVVSSILSLSPDPWLFYGSDADGVRKSQAITERLGWKYINTPAPLLPEVNDVYSFVKAFGLEKLEEFCKFKTLIK